MFRIIKKWYFKIYHLFKLLGIFILIFGIKENVFAEECNNLYKGEPGKVWLRNGYRMVSSLTGSSNYNTNTATTCNSETNICIDASKTYTIYATNQNGEVVDLLLNGMTNVVFLSQTIYPNQENIKKYTIEGTYISTNENIFRYIYPSGTGVPNEIYQEVNSWQWYVVEGTEICLPNSGGGQTEDNVYSNFLTLYLDRITYLANGFATNPYLLTMIGIIFAWIVLEITLKIINIRRKK